MFDFSFSELALIGVVALVVIGPERLPKVARTAGVVAGRLQRYAAAVRADIAREVEMSELRRVQDEIQDAARSFEGGLRDSLASAESQLEAGRQALMTGPQPAPVGHDPDHAVATANDAPLGAAPAEALTLSPAEPLPALLRESEASAAGALAGAAAIDAPDATIAASTQVPAADAIALAVQASLFLDQETPPGESAAAPRPAGKA